MVRLLCPRPLRFPERTVLRRHPYLRTVQQLPDGKNLDALVVLTPARRVIETCADRLLSHVAGRLLQGDEHSHGCVFTFYGASQVAYVAALDLTGLDLHKHPLRLASPIVYKVDNAVYTLVATLLASLAATLST